jgi:hypothetical protein
MSMRQAEGTGARWLDTRVEAGFSNFLFIDRNYSAHPVMRRIFSLARKHGFQSVLIEDLEERNCPLLSEENEALAKRMPNFKDSKVQRLCFFRSPSDRDPAPADFIGSVIFKSDSLTGLPHPRSHVYEALLPPPRSSQENNFIHCGRRYEFHTAVGDFSSHGALYAQQNDMTFVCAHVALRSALASLVPDADITYAEINCLAGVDHLTKQVGGGMGLDPDQMEMVLNGFGIAYEKIVHEPASGLTLPTDYQRSLYGFIESGGPALLGFELEDPSASPGAAGRHIIPVLGHTFNEDAWVPEADRSYFAKGLSYYPSESWLSAFVAHDDNFGPYYCLPRNFLKKENFRLSLGLKRFPSLFGAVEAESLAFGYAQILSQVFDKTGLDWLDRFSIFTRLGSLVIRSQSISRADYLHHLEGLDDWLGKSLEAQLVAELTSGLPDYFWMAELSAPELFTATRHKLGELLIAADTPHSTDLSLLLAARLPGHVLTKTNGKFEVKTTALEGHTPLFSRIFA